MLVFFIFSNLHDELSGACFDCACLLSWCLLAPGSSASLLCFLIEVKVESVWISMSTMGNINRHGFEFVQGRSASCLVKQHLSHWARDCLATCISFVLTEEW